MFGTRFTKRRWLKIIESSATAKPNEERTAYEEVRSFTDDDGTTVFVYKNRGVTVRKRRKIKVEDASNDWRRL